MSIFKYTTKIELYHSDATGALFYGSLFMLIHQTFSAFLKSRKGSLKELIEKNKLLCPVVHTEGDFFYPLTPDDEVEIEIEDVQIGRTSFTLKYEVKHKERLAASAKVVHVCLGANQKKIEVPEKILKLFEKN